MGQGQLFTLCRSFLIPGSAPPLPACVQIETFMVGGKRVSLHTSVLEEKATGE
jgi:hypothetical protein